MVVGFRRSIAGLGLRDGCRRLIREECGVLECQVGCAPEIGISLSVSWRLRKDISARSACPAAVKYSQNIGLSSSSSQLKSGSVQVD